MALEAHVLLSGTDRISSHHKLGDALTRLNEASFAGIGGVAVVAVGKTQEDAYDRVVGFTDEPATDGDSVA